MTVQIPRTARYRRERTIRSAMLHHGATTADTLPAAHGLWLALLHAASTKTLKMLLKGSNKAMLCISQILREEKAAFEMSNHNKVRSVGLLYSGSVMSKAKYRKCFGSLVRRYDRRRKKKIPLEIADGMRVDQPLSYDKLHKFIKTIDVGKIMPLPDPAVRGARRDLEDLLLKMAERVFTVKALREEVKWLNQEEGHFRYALGGDGAPLNKCSDLTMIMVSLINCGHRVGSPNENFVYAVADVDELHPVWLQVLRDAVQDAAVISEKSYTICGKRCTFTPQLVPADQKWLAHVAGELPNSATYFSSYANVKLDDLGVVNKTFRMNGSGDFRPWTWEERQDAIKSVQEKIQSLPEGTSKSQAHDAALKVLANVANARQLHQPAIGRLVETATVDPLHVMNNAWQHLFTCIVGVLISQSQQTVDGEYDKDSPIVRFLVFLKKNLHLNRLRRKLDEWIKSHDGDKAPALQIRLNGLESRKFCQNVMGIINCLAPNARGSSRRLAVLHSLAYIALKLRDVVALFSRYTITDDEVKDLETKCRLYFNAAVLFSRRSPRRLCGPSPTSCLNTQRN